MAKKIVLRYSQRWISNFDRRKLVFGDESVEPRHLSTGKCLCQFFEDEYRLKSQGAPIERFAYQDSSDIIVEPPRRLKPLTSSRGHVKHPSPIPTVSSRFHSDSGNVTIDIDLGSRYTSAFSADDQGDCGFRPFNHEVDYESSHSTLSYHQSDVDDIELGSNELSITRSDDLIRKLRLFLQLRKEELQNFDGSLFSSAFDHMPTPFIVPNKNVLDNSSLGTSNDAITDTDGRQSDNSDDVNCMTRGKRFFNQRGLFSLTTNSSKKVPRDNKTCNALEVC